MWVLIMRSFNEYARNHNDIKLRSGEKIFGKQVNGIEGVDLIIDGKEERGLVHNNINPTSEKEYRSLHIPNHVIIQRGSYVQYNEESYLVTTDVDSHYVYQSCKIQKCNQILKWKQDGIIHEVPCIIANDSYGVKELSDNDFIRTQNIKAQITIQNNAITRKIIKDMRFLFNHSENDIYGVIDINTSLAHGIITLTMEKVVYQREDDLENNLAFSSVLTESNEKNENNKPDNNENYQIIGMDSICQQAAATYSLNPINKECIFYMDEFDLDSIAFIVEQSEGVCTIQAKKLMSDTWCTLYAKDAEDNILCEKEIQITKR